MTKVVAMVLAGGDGTRLRPLTAQHAKPALVLARGYRIIDFVLSNLINSGIETIHVLVQYKPRSLIQHLDAAWAPWCASAEHCIEVVRPRSERPQDAFKGTADAVYQNLHLLERHRPDLVAIFAADHVYRMDVRQMIDFHLRHRADITVAALPVPIERASDFGVICTDALSRIRDFQEKPAHPAPMPQETDRAFASMGNYLFHADALRALLEDCHGRGEADFGRHVLPRALQGRHMLAYDFTRNAVPGVKAYEEAAYWRDVGTVQAFREAQRDVTGSLPRFSLSNTEWPLRVERGRQVRQSVDAAAAAAQVMA